MSDVLDLQPMLRKRKQDTCAHDQAEVDMAAAVLDCIDCGAPLDPWWYLRKIVTHEEEFQRHNEALQRHYDEIVRTGTAQIAVLNERIELQNRELSRLIAAKNELWNERAPDGQPLGAHARRR